MIRKTMLLLILLAIPEMSFADGFEDVAKDPAFAYLQEYKRIINQQLPIIEERMKNINPELVESVKNESDETKIIKYNNYLAEKTFDIYKESFLNDMEQQGKKTGREIKTADYSNGNLYKWLDAGKMDQEKCNGGTYIPKRNSRYEINKMLRDQRKHTCLYPNGFKEYSIEIDDSADNTKNSLSREKSMVVCEDLPDEGIRIEYSVFLQQDSNIEDKKTYYSSEQSIIFSVDYTIYDYIEYHKWRNQDRQDIKDGMLEYIPKAKQMCRSESTCVSVRVKDVEKWKSSRLPKMSIKGYTFDTFRQTDITY